MPIGLELLIALVMVPLLSLIHGWGLMGMSHMFNLTDEALLRQRMSPRSIVLVAFVAALLFMLHGVEIGVIGLLFWLTHGAGTIEDGMVDSASYYTTTGSTSLPDGWRVIGQAEALLGLLLIGWSTAFLVRKIDRLADRRAEAAEEARRQRLRGTGYGHARREELGD
jgi:hypothetical protein